MTLENLNPELERARANAYLEVLRETTEKKGSYGNNWRVVNFTNGQAPEVMIEKEKIDGEILLYSIPEDFRVNL